LRSSNRLASHLALSWNELEPSLRSCLRFDDARVTNGGRSILWQRPKPSRTHGITMSPKRGMCTPHTICRALEPSFVRLSTPPVLLQTPTGLLSSLWFISSCEAMPAKALVCCQTASSLSRRAACAVGSLPLLRSRRRMGRPLFRLSRPSEDALGVLLSMVLHPAPCSLPLGLRGVSVMSRPCDR